MPETKTFPYTVPLKEIRRLCSVEPPKTLPDQSDICLKSSIWHYTYFTNFDKHRIRIIDSCHIVIAIFLKNTPKSFAEISFYSTKRFKFGSSTNFGLCELGTPWDPGYTVHWTKISLFWPQNGRHFYFGLEKPKFPAKIPFHMPNSIENEPNFTLSRFQKDRIMRSLIIAAQILHI